MDHQIVWNEQEIIKLQSSLRWPNYILLCLLSIFVDFVPNVAISAEIYPLQCDHIIYTKTHGFFWKGYSNVSVNSNGVIPSGEDLCPQTNCADHWRVTKLHVTQSLDGKKTFTTIWDWSGYIRRPSVPIINGVTATYVPWLYDETGWPLWMYYASSQYSEYFVNQMEASACPSCPVEKSQKEKECGGEDMVDWTTWNDQTCTGGQCKTDPKNNLGSTCPIN